MKKNLDLTAPRVIPLNRPCFYHARVITSALTQLSPLSRTAQCARFWSHRDDLYLRSARARGTKGGLAIPPLLFASAYLCAVYVTADVKEERERERKREREREREKEISEQAVPQPLTNSRESSSLRGFPARARGDARVSARVPRSPSVSPHRRADDFFFKPSYVATRA